MKPKHADDGSRCPLWRKPCIKVCHACEMWDHFEGKHPQTGADLSGWRCSIKMQAIIGMDAIRVTHQAKDAIANPGAAIAYVKERDGIVNTQLETRRLQLAIDTVVNSADARAEGFGQVVPTRLSLMASQVSDVYATKTRVNPAEVWNGSFLPSAAELNILPKK